MKFDFKTLFKLGIAVFLVYLCINYWNDVAGALLGASAPIIIGLVIAYLVNIIMSSYERHYFRKSNKKFFKVTRRPVCMIAAFLTVAAVIALIVGIVAPQLVSCVQVLISKLPYATTVVINKLNNVEFISKEFLDSLAKINWQEVIDKITGIATSGVGVVVDVVVKSVTMVFSTVVTVFLSIIFAVYILLSKEKLKAQASKVLKHYTKPDWYKKIVYFFNTINECFRRYIVGQCTEAVILGVLCTVGMYILGIPYAPMIGALIAFTALIPIAGAFIGAGIGAFMILTENPVKALIFIIYILILQQLEGNIIYPKVVGTSIGLPAIWVLAAVTVGGGMFGVVGMLIFVPITAAVWKIVKDDINKNPRKEIEVENRV